MHDKVNRLMMAVPDYLRKIPGDNSEYEVIDPKLEWSKAAVESAIQRNEGWVRISSGQNAVKDGLQL